MKYCNNIFFKKPQGTCIFTRSVFISIRRALPITRILNHSWTTLQLHPLTINSFLVVGLAEREDDDDIISSECARGSCHISSPLPSTRPLAYLYCHPGRPKPTRNGDMLCSALSPVSRGSLGSKKPDQTRDGKRSMAVGESQSYAQVWKKKHCQASAWFNVFLW